MVQQPILTRLCAARPTLLGSTRLHVVAPGTADLERTGFEAWDSLSHTCVSTGLCGCATLSATPSPGVHLTRLASLMGWGSLPHAKNPHLCLEESPPLKLPLGPPETGRQSRTGTGQVRRAASPLPSQEP